MRDFKFLNLLFLLCIFSSCKDSKNERETRDTEIRYRYFNLEKNGWKSKNYTQNVGNINFQATEVPIIYYLLKDLGNSELLKVDSLYEANKTERIIEFTFSENDEKDLLKEEFTNLNYQKSVEYLSFKIEKDFKIVTSKKDTINCSGVLHERNFKIAPFNKVVLFFSGIPSEENIQLVYKDNLFRKGTLKFQFNESVLKL